MRHDQIVSKYCSISGFAIRDRSTSSEFLLAKGRERKERRNYEPEEHLLLHLDYSPQKARVETVVI